MNIDSVDVILPCLDEAAALPGVLEALPEGYRAIVVDNGSTDSSPEVAAAWGAKVVREPRRGYGAAVHTGVEHASADVVCVLDADGSLDPGELTALVARVAPGTLVVGARRPEGRGVWPWHARMGNRVVAALLRRRGVAVTDIGPVRVAPRTELLDLGVRDRAFGYPLEVLLRAAGAGWSIVELPMTYRARHAGTRSKVTGTVRGTLRAVRDMSRVLR
ncbi:glycosyltransferase family 2 protein [Saccharomonospora piscinae]|uniref:Glycosyltransferase n=1 Tax=Saccharomonospora piscinae TaxID=687388 RepID=A0A1V9AAI7_SACPI|nr:glycosyltransferase family 2 protein [Saccharomonospora piscinae]OQO94139.1 glycosyltransferase [Saccharomonospora piscinae]TLW94991.1 glycosyltransferase family 2 protein [Saccharomonospora piscinae]